VLGGIVYLTGVLRERLGVEGMLRHVLGSFSVGARMGVGGGWAQVSYSLGTRSQINW
jgi:hypothetical protein